MSTALLDIKKQMAAFVEQVRACDQLPGMTLNETNREPFINSILAGLRAEEVIDERDIFDALHARRTGVNAAVAFVVSPAVMALVIEAMKAQSQHPFFSTRTPLFSSPIVAAPWLGFADMGAFSACVSALQEIEKLHGVIDKIETAPWG